MEEVCKKNVFSQRLGVNSAANIDILGTIFKPCNDTLRMEALHFSTRRVSSHLKWVTKHFHDHITLTNGI